MSQIPIHLFFAVLPPETTCPTIGTLGSNLQRAHGLHGTRIAMERLHMTVAPIYPMRGSLADTVARARSVAAGIQYGRFPICFEWSESFPLRRNRHPLVLRGDQGLQPMTGLRQEIRAQMMRAGFTVERSFTPHLTLLWADRCVEAYPIAPITWTVRDFVLVLSLPGQSRHIHVGHWQLQ